MHVLSGLVVVYCVCINSVHKKWALFQKLLGCTNVYVRGAVIHHTTAQFKYAYYFKVLGYSYRRRNQGAITNTLPNFSVFYGTFNNAVSRIESNRTIQETVTTGSTQNKKEAKDALGMAAYDLSKKLTAYAMVTKNNVLISEVELSMSKLRGMADTTLLDKSTLIYTRAQSNVGNLTAYNVTSNTQTAFNTLITNYRNLLPTPRLMQAERKEATRNLLQAFDEADVALKTIDSLVEIVKATQTTFYSKYLTARTVVQYRNQKKVFNSKVTDTLGRPVPNVELSFKNVGTPSLRMTNTIEPAQIIKKTGINGLASLKSLPSGTYEVQISKPGYKSQTSTHNQIEGEIGRLNVILQAE
jgi:hypothetical protein